MTGVKYSLEDPTAGELKVRKYNRNTLIFSYPCQSDTFCTSYKVDLAFGAYKIECYGAGINSGGGYTSGIITVQNNLTIYLFLGSQGHHIDYEEVSNNYPVFNGGGGGNITASQTGNGATDVRLSPGPWYSFESLKSRIMVAGGSGGSECGLGGVGGGLEGGNGESGKCWGETGTYSGIGYGGKQNQGGEGHFTGLFGTAESSTVRTNMNGGGGGYYGGGSCFDGGAGGGGGSSFISGYQGCNAISENSTFSNRIHTNQPIHYSNIVFSNAVMQSGAEEFTRPDRITKETGHKSHGNVVITRIIFDPCTMKLSLFSLFHYISFMTYIFIILPS